MSNGEIDEHITRLYDIKRRLGKGAYGIVWKAIDRKTKEVVAVKKIYDAFRNQTDAQRTYREIMFLQEFGCHPNVIKLYNIHKASNNVDIYLIFEYMDTDLNNVITQGNILKDIHKRFIMYQLFKATAYIHSGNVIHRDQKPSNILLDAKCRCKIADFGLARSVTMLNDGSGDGVGDPSLTDYVATRWYRAPEILVASKRYTHGVDMWSLGCILGEMLLGKPLFPGSSTVNQVERILATIQPPTPEDIIMMCTGHGKVLLSRVPSGPRRPLKDLLHDAPPDALDLVSRLLVFNPHKRLTASEALKHPYVQRFYVEEQVHLLNYDVLPPFRDDIQLTVDDYRNKLYELMSARKISRIKPGTSAEEAQLCSAYSEAVCAASTCCQNRGASQSGSSGSRPCTGGSQTADLPDGVLVNLGGYKSSMMQGDIVPVFLSPVATHNQNQYTNIQDFMLSPGYSDHSTVTPRHMVLSQHQHLKSYALNFADNQKDSSVFCFICLVVQIKEEFDPYERDWMETILDM